MMKRNRGEKLLKSIDQSYVEGRHFLLGSAESTVGKISRLIIFKWNNIFTDVFSLNYLSFFNLSPVGEKKQKKHRDSFSFRHDLFFAGIQTISVLQLLQIKWINSSLLKSWYQISPFLSEIWTKQLESRWKSQTIFKPDAHTTKRIMSLLNEIQSSLTYSRGFYERYR